MGSLRYLLAALTATMMFVVSCSTAPSAPTMIAAENVIVEQMVAPEQQTSISLLDHGTPPK